MVRMDLFLLIEVSFFNQLRKSKISALVVLAEAHFENTEWVASLKKARKEENSSEVFNNSVLQASLT